MQLADFLEYNNIVIQCHDNPDADALASGFGLKTYFDAMGKKSRFIYRGKKAITKSNLLIMISELGIPVTYEPDFDENPELLILVDCQYGQRNVTTTKAQNIAVIDHHQKCTDLPKLSELRSSIGSCSTIIWNLIKEEGLEPNDDRNLATALYYGLFTDTNKLSEVSHPVDRDMVDELTVNKSIITYMCNSNISIDELAITGRAILNNQYSEENSTLIIHAEPCDPNILGVISDFSLEADKVNICVAYYESETEIKFSVRSCTKEVHANELAAFISQDCGGGGGHLRKAGGTIQPELIACTAEELITARIVEYFEKYRVIHAKTATIDATGMKRYKKTQQIVGTVKLDKIYEAGTEVELRTMEGDINIIIENDTYLMIGIEGEIYPIKEEKLLRSYNKMPFKYQHEYEYEPNIKNRKTGEKKLVMPYAESCTTKDSAPIMAKPLTYSVKLFTAWDDEKYYKGEPGDYIAVRADDAHDIYIINKNVFPKLYQEI